MRTPLFISVVIPTYHRNDRLAQCLDLLAPTAQIGLSDAYEVIVTDDGTASDASNLISERYPWVRWVAGPKRGPAANRNFGASQATGEWIAFTDDDCLPDSRWLCELAGEARQGRLKILEGKTVPTEAGDAPFMYYVENIDGGNYWSCNLAVQRETFLALGGFDEDFLEAGGEDMEFAFRIKKANLPATFVNTAIIRHPARRLDLRFLVWRTQMIRWKSLYDLKTGSATPVDAPLLPVLVQLSIQNLVDLFRTSWHVIKGRYRGRTRSQLVQLIWKWMTFPIALPYSLVWEVRFRQMLKQRLLRGGGD